MKQQNRVLTTIDRRRLGTLVQNVHDQLPHLRFLAQLLEDAVEQARGVDPEQIPRDVVTMNSTVVLRDLESRQAEKYTLTYPSHADIRHDRLSVLAPSGMAIIGRAIGDVVDVPDPSGTHRLRVEAIDFQPERAGRLDL